jgi:hypothetical protein
MTQNPNALTEMTDAPEGLAYSHDNDKYSRTPLNENYKETGKILSGESRERDPAHLAAEELRLGGKGSVDPKYGDCRKVK